MRTLTRNQWSLFTCVTGTGKRWKKKRLYLCSTSLLWKCQHSLILEQWLPVNVNIPSSWNDDYLFLFYMQDLNDTGMILGPVFCKQRQHTFYETLIILSCHWVLLPHVETMEKPMLMDEGLARFQKHKKFGNFCTFSTVTRIGKCINPEIWLFFKSHTHTNINKINTASLNIPWWCRLGFSEST